MHVRAHARTDTTHTRHTHTPHTHTPHTPHTSHTHTHTTHTQIQCPAQTSATVYFVQESNQSNLTVLSKMSKSLSNKNLFFSERNIQLFLSFLKTQSLLLNMVFPYLPTPPPRYQKNVDQNEMKIKSLNYFSSPLRSTRSANTWGCSLKTFNIKPESTICSGYGTLDQARYHKVVRTESRKLKPKKCSNFFLKNEKKSPQQREKYFRRYHKEKKTTSIIIVL